jgi:hypothetical protein
MICFFLASACCFLTTLRTFVATDFPRSVVHTQSGSKSSSKNPRFEFVGGSTAYNQDADQSFTVHRSIYSTRIYLAFPVNTYRTGRLHDSAASPTPTPAISLKLQENLNIMRHDSAHALTCFILPQQESFGFPIGRCVVRRLIHDSRRRRGAWPITMCHTDRVQDCGKRG